MFSKLFLFLFLTIFSLTVSLFSEKTQSDHISASHAILEHAPESIYLIIDDKLYIDENYLFEGMDNLCIGLSSGESIKLPTPLQDSLETYLVTGPTFGKKLFINICNKCEYAWEGGVFTFRCPECGSTDFRTVPNF